MIKAARTILVVDDEAHERDHVSSILHDQGMFTQAAGSAQEALDKVLECPPDLVALDVLMPHKSGLSVYRELRRGDRFRHIPVIMISAADCDFRTFLSRRRIVPPPDGFVDKPVRPDDLLEKVRELIG